MDSSQQSQPIAKIIITKTELPKLEGSWTVGEVRLAVKLLSDWLENIHLTTGQDDEKKD